MIDALPPAPDPTHPSTYTTLGAAFMAALPNFGVQANALAASMNNVASGAAQSITYTFSNSTVVGDPTPGFLRLNQAVQNTSTQIIFDPIDAVGQDRTATINTFDDSTSLIKGTLLAVNQADATKWMAFAITALAAPAGYFTLTVTCVDQSAASPFVNGNGLLLKFTRNGDKGDVGSLGAGSATQAAGNVVLTNVSAPVQRVSGDTWGRSVTHPDATTMTTNGSPIFVHRNTGEFPMALKDKGGSTLGFHYPMETATLSLHDKTTLAGLWDVEDAHLLAIQAQLAFTGLSLGTTGKVQSIKMDADRDMLLFGGTSCYAVVYTRSTASAGTPTLVRSGLGAGQFWGVLAAADKVLVLSDLATSTTTSLQGAVLSTVANAITVNTASNAATALAISQYGAAVVAFNGAFAFSYVRGASGAAVIGISIAGNAVTFGAEQTIGAANSQSAPPHLYVTGTSLMTITADRTNLTAKSWTNAGAALVPGTAATAAMAQNTMLKTAVWGAHWIALVGLGTNNPTVFDISLAGSVSSITSVSAGLTNVASAIDVGVVSATKAVVVGLDATADTNVCINVLTDNGAGTISAGTQVVIGGSAVAPVFLGASGNVARLVSSEGFIYSVDCSGASPVVTQARMLINTSQIATFAQADSYMLQRNYATLLAGSAWVPLPTAGGQLSLLAVSQNAHRLLAADFMPCGAAGCVGDDATESWVFVQPMTNGVFLQLVKSATPA
jgi:hypothetical protein